MSTVILTATQSHPALHALVRLVHGELSRDGDEDVRAFDLAERALGHCHGQLDCELRTEGTCGSDELEQQVLQAIHDAHNLVLVDEVTFGGHGSVMKHALDRLLCRLLPALERRVTVTHHGLRYERPFALFALGFAAARSAPMAGTFRTLATANALNFAAPHVGSDVFVITEQSRWPEQLRHALDAAHAPADEPKVRSDLRSELVQLARADTRAALPPPRSAAVLVGSAKRAGSGVSETLAQASADRLRAGGLLVTVYRASELMDAAPAALDTLQRLVAVDLLQLVTPLYVDALPGPATWVLERLARLRARSVPPARFSMIVQSGAPEPEQNRHAVAIARHFAASAGYHWSGSLVLGGGGVVDALRPLDTQQGPVEHLRRGLDVACAALARGGVIEGPAVQAVLRASSPPGRLLGAGNLGFRLAARESALAERVLGDAQHALARRTGKRTRTHA